jgi:hypothetical protein
LSVARITFSLQLDIEQPAFRICDRTGWWYLDKPAKEFWAPGPRDERQLDIDSDEFLAGEATPDGRYVCERCLTGTEEDAIADDMAATEPHDLRQSQSTPSRRAHPPESDSSMA